MGEMRQFMQAVCLMLLLGIWAVGHSPFPYVCLLTEGMLLLLFSVRSLYEKQSVRMVAGQLVLSVLFCWLSAGFLSFLVFVELRVSRKSRVRCLFPAGVYFTHTWLTSDTDLPDRIVNAMLLLVLSGGIILMERWVEAYLLVQKRAEQSVSVTAVSELYEKKLNQELLLKNYLADRNARLEERENISRNIHNSVGHSITAAVMTLDAADLLFDSNPERAREKLNVANGRMRESLDAIRHAVRVLDAEREFLELEDLVRELTAVTEQFAMDTEVRIRTDFAGVEGGLLLPKEYTEFLTGALQELLTNGVRHGMADIFTVNLLADSGHILLGVWDNGMSDFSEENEQERVQNGFGLKKMIQYAKRFGGTVQISNENGFEVSITLPLYHQ